MLSAVLKALATLLCIVVWRVYTILPPRVFQKPPQRKHDETCTLAVFLGSGGHTTEAMIMLSAIDPKRYRPRHYFVSEGDTLSVRKALELEETFGRSSSDFRTTIIPRARRVHQSFLTAPFTALISLASCIYYMTLEPLLDKKTKFTDVLVVNGPGTCLMLCLAVFINKFIGLPAPTIIYVESFARVSSLSITGKLIRPLADR
ncbi:UDP-N-acetylglucosamine transferase subunit ALG14 [Coprinopsis sp. MPI-PUGE-AT-0042]|nr:UDP-N-acetylglucosamine transferase subunit ALG14 [Coprinopsis sp. MPI-PUGE-AT-0042]